LPDDYKMYTPIAMTPISKLPGGPRRPSRAVLEIPDSIKYSHNPEDFNPDGSLKTMHVMPKLDKSYAEARKTRYVRHRDTPEWEKSLTVKEVFNKK